MLKFDEKQLYQSGFKKLQEKEDMIYYEKFTNKNEQIFVIYDKNNHKIKSIDTYSFDNNEMRISSKNPKIV